MVFGKKKITEKIVEEVKKVEVPMAEEISVEESVSEEAEEISSEEDLIDSAGTEETATGLDNEFNNEINAVLGQIQSRITTIEATLYRLTNR